MKIINFRESGGVRYCVKFADTKADLELSIADRGGIRLYKDNVMVFERPNEELSDLVEVVRLIGTAIDPIATGILMPAKKAREELVRVQLGEVEDLISRGIKSGYSYTAFLVDTDREGERFFKGMPMKELLEHLRAAGYKYSWHDDETLKVSW